MILKVIICSEEFCHTTDESLASFHRNRGGLPGRHLQQKCSINSNRELIKRDPSASSGGIKCSVYSSNIFTRNFNVIGFCQQTEMAAVDNLSASRARQETGQECNSRLGFKVKMEDAGL
ncbi:unnamed protein product [Protopolystoma xenopodis]|uniref:Uncharacterized protein n=1 Tax=Protopolystoma xenopodis TaxID=117903 RepID=A0A3S4ZRP9_9PLAT|nr:unnamed protein product [Protopolystoma xenopodis]